MFKDPNNVVEHAERYALNMGLPFYRPGTFKETLKKLIKEPDLISEFPYFDTITGLAHLPNTNLIKINPYCTKLLNLPREFREKTIKTDYKSFEGEEVNLKKIGKKDLRLLAMGGITSENDEIFREFHRIFVESKKNKEKIPEEHNFRNKNKIYHRFKSQVSEEILSFLTLYTHFFWPIVGDNRLSDFDKYSIIIKETDFENK